MSEEPCVWLSSRMSCQLHHSVQQTSLSWIVQGKLRAPSKEAWAPGDGERTVEQKGDCSWKLLWFSLACCKAVTQASAPGEIVEDLWGPLNAPFQVVDLRELSIWSEVMKGQLDINQRVRRPSKCKISLKLRTTKLRQLCSWYYTLQRLYRPKPSLQDAAFPQNKTSAWREQSTEALSNSLLMAMAQQTLQSLTDMMRNDSNVHARSAIDFYTISSCIIFVAKTCLSTIQVCTSYTKQYTVYLADNPPGCVSKTILDPNFQPSSSSACTESYALKTCRCFAVLQQLQKAAED